MKNWFGIKKLQNPPSVAKFQWLLTNKVTDDQISAFCIHPIIFRIFGNEGLVCLGLKQKEIERIITLHNTVQLQS